MAGKKSSALARIVQCIEITNKDGTTTLVPVSKEDNARANKVLASQIRALIQANIASYQGKIMLPKELKEIADAAKTIADFSGEVYKDNETVGDSEEKNVTGNDKAAPLPSEVSFDVLIQSPKSLKPPAEEESKK